MTITERLLPEFDREMAGTRRMLERAPADKFAWKPHPKSRTLGELANHVSAIPAIVTIVIARQSRPAAAAESPAEMLAEFDQNVAAAREAIVGATDAHWSATIDVHPLFTNTRETAVRGRMMNHLIHHRGQLSAYLRLLDVAVPGMYGPSGDEP